MGCAHYKRRAKFVTPCCNKLYMCRYCHDEHETHYFNRKTVTQLICTECDTRQRVQAECEKCGVRFGKVRGKGIFYYILNLIVCIGGCAFCLK